MLVVRETYDALAKGNLDDLRGSLLADDVVFHVPGRGALAGDYRGKDEVLNYLTRLGELSGNTMGYEPESFLVDGDRVAAMVRVRGERGDRRLEDHGVHMFRVSDGKITERWSYPYDPYLFDEFSA
ncbi:nuclear transport factor 2 family protein [Microbispora sp. H11081]|uniref:nuclear transport factor 2 family protein n=1 Tax=Microbispora sp. H11081 TaxID=2729107 RepID=UPI001B8BA3AC|nr:nuclear transport factor 2 family protein [Microbispora sp. H11081]